MKNLDIEYFVNQLERTANEFEEIRTKLYDPLYQPSRMELIELREYCGTVNAITKLLRSEYDRSIQTKKSWKIWNR